MSKLDSVKNIFLFRGASESDYQVLAELAITQDVLAGDFLYRSGEPAKDIYYIEHGSFDLSKSEAATPLATLGSGQTFGEGPFFEGETRVVNAQAKEASTVLKIPYAGLKALFEKNPALELTVYQNEVSFLVKTLRNIAGEMHFRYF